MTGQDAIAEKVQESIWNGQQALTPADDHPGGIHALVTDVVMPVTNGRELAKALHTALR